MRNNIFFRLPQKSQIISICLLLLLSAGFYSLASAEETTPCTPDCAGKVCGDDTCGGSCGPACAAPNICNSLGQCARTSRDIAVIALIRFSDPTVNLAEVLVDQ